MTVAALYVERNGVYYGLPDVDPWDEERDARLYAGPWPVVAHPPCTRWSRMGLCRGYYDGNDGGCFEAALHAVRTYGGVLEHPALTLAWKRFALPRPARGGWTEAIGDQGLACEVDQAHYGFPARKPTWLYYVGPEPPALRWGRSRHDRSAADWGYGDRRTGESAPKRSRTPLAFRDVLLGMARSALPDGALVRTRCGLNHPETPVSGSTMRPGGFTHVNGGGAQPGGFGSTMRSESVVTACRGRAGADPVRTGGGEI